MKLRPEAGRANLTDSQREKDIKTPNETATKQRDQPRKHLANPKTYTKVVPKTIPNPPQQKNKMRSIR